MLVTTADQLEEAVRYLLDEADYFCFDVETMGHRLDTWRNDVVWLTVGDAARQWSIPMNFPNGEFVEERYPLKDSVSLRERLARGLQPRKSDYSVDRKKANKIFTEPPEHLSRTEVFSALKPCFFEPSLLKVGHNLAFDLGSVAKYLGDIPCGPYADTRIAAFLVDSTKEYGFGLKDVAKKYADIDMVKGVGKFVENHSLQEVHEYALLDVVATSQVWEVLRQKIEEDRLSVAFNLEMQVLPVVARMKLIGAPIDTEQLIVLRESLDADIEKVKDRIFRIAGRPFTLTSNSEKQQLLYGPKESGGRGLVPTVLTPGGKDRDQRGAALTISDYSVSAEALEAWRGQDQLVDALLEHSGLNKLLSTYVLPYLGTDAGEGLVDRDGRIHTDFNQIGAATGRFSSSNPNLQNVPGSSTEYGKKIRNLFVAPEGHSLVVADYSQIEPRLIAAFSKDEVMVDAYRRGDDIYTTIGDRMGVDRKAGKVLVLSIAYGVGPQKISKSIGCTVDEAKELLNEFSQKFPNVDRLKASTITKAVNHARSTKTVPYVCTISGRRRYLPDLFNDTFYVRLRAQRQAFNTLIQGSAADVMKMAIVFANEDIPEPSYITLTVHDELVVVTPTELAEETAFAVKSAMEDVANCALLSSLGVPLVSEVAIADRWGEAK